MVCCNPQPLEVVIALITHILIIIVHALLACRTIVPPNVVVVRIQTSDGQSRTMQVPMRQFHQLRFNAAKVSEHSRWIDDAPELWS